MQGEERFNMTVLTQRWRGLMMFLLGMATVVGTLFMDSCADAGHYATLANGMQIHMGCTWTERAVLGLGGLVMVIGVIMLAAFPVARYLSMAGAAAGVLLLATPLWLIPTCANPMMPCNMSLKPGSLLLGGLITLGGLVGSVQLRRTQKPPVVQRMEQAQ